MLCNILRKNRAPLFVQGLFPGLLRGFFFIFELLGQSYFRQREQGFRGLRRHFQLPVNHKFLRKTPNCHESAIFRISCCLYATLACQQRLHNRSLIL